MTDNSEYWLVPGDEDGYYTREPDGVSGMIVTSLAKLCGVDQSAITQMLNKIRDSDPIMNDLEDCLKSYAGKELRLITNDLGGRLIILDEVCQAILEYYAFDARSYTGKEIAVNNFRAIAKAGMRFFIWSKTGYLPSELRKEEAKRGSYWYKRIGLAMSDSDNPLQAGYFCVYVEMMRFFSELEMRVGYVVDDKNLITGQYIVPDISIGLCFNNWLRSDDELPSLARQEFLGSGEPIDFRRPSPKVPDGGKHRHEILDYNHVYPIESHGEDNAKLSNSYPNKYKSIFHYYLEEYYIPDKCLNYIKDRDPQGIENLKKTISLMPEKTKRALSNTLVGRFIRGLLPPSR